MKRVFILFSLVLCFAAALWAQPRPVERSATTDGKGSYEARYEGGMFGSGAKEKGNLKFDDANLRMVFYRADGKEMFTIPFDALIVVYPDSKSEVPQAGKVMSKVPLPGAGLFELMSKDAKFVNLTFDDPDIEAKGTASFRFDNKEQLLDFIHNLGGRAKMLQRGDAYYRPKKGVM